MDLRCSCMHRQADTHHSLLAKTLFQVLIAPPRLLGASYNCQHTCAAACTALETRLSLCSLPLCDCDYSPPGACSSSPSAS